MAATDSSNFETACYYKGTNEVLTNWSSYIWKSGSPYLYIVILSTIFLAKSGCGKKVFLE